MHVMVVHVEVVALIVAVLHGCCGAGGGIGRCSGSRGILSTSEF